MALFPPTNRSDYSVPHELVYIYIYDVDSYIDNDIDTTCRVTRFNPSNPFYYFTLSKGAVTYIMNIDDILYPGELNNCG